MAVLMIAEVPELTEEIYAAMIPQLKTPMPDLPPRPQRLRPVALPVPFVFTRPGSDRTGRSAGG